MRVASHTTFLNSSLQISDLISPNNALSADRKISQNSLATGISTDTDSPSSEGTASATASTAAESDFGADDNTDAATYTPMIRSHSLPFMPISPATPLPVPSTFYGQTMPQQMMVLPAPIYHQQTQSALSNVTAQIEYAHQMHLLMNAPPNYYAQPPQTQTHAALTPPPFHANIMAPHDTRVAYYPTDPTSQQHHTSTLVQSSAAVHPSHQHSHQPPAHPQPQPHAQSPYLTSTPLSTLSMHDEVGGVDMGLVLGSKLIVKFLPPNTTQTALFDLFSPFGPLLTCKLITDKRTHQSLGYAFLSYTSAANAHVAIAQLNGMILEKRPIRVQLCQHADLYSNSNKTTLWVSGLPRAHSHTDVHVLFSQYGSVKHVQMCGEEKKKGLAMVEFELPGEARRAIEQLHGRSLEQVYGTHHSGGINGGVPAGWTVPLVVKFAHEPSVGAGASDKSPANSQRQTQSARADRFRQQMSSPPTQQNQFAFSTLPSSTAYTPTNSYAASTPGDDTRPPHSATDRSLHPSSSSAASSQSSSNGLIGGPAQQVGDKSHRNSDTVSLFVFHLPGSLTELDLKDLFRRHCSVVSVRIVHDQLTGESKGYGFVNVQSADDATAAITALNGYAIDKKFIKVERKSGRGIRQSTANNQSQYAPPEQAQSNAMESKVSESHPPTLTHTSNGQNTIERSSSNSGDSSSSSDTYNSQQSNIDSSAFTSNPIINAA